MSSEMVRRAERALGVAIRKGQDAGEITTVATAAQQRELKARGALTTSCPSPTEFSPGAHRPRADKTMSLPTNYASSNDLSGNGAGIYQLTDDVSDDQFEDALTEAREEGNLSRANAVRLRPTKFTRVLAQATLSATIGLIGVWVLVSMLDAEAVL